MSRHPLPIETEIAIVGSGPGGAALALALTKQGRKVAVVEQGRWHRWAIGRLAAYGTITKTIRSIQGGTMARGITAGGSSVVFNGNAFDPPPYLASEWGIDLSREVSAIKAELLIRPLPREFYARWSASARLVEAAARLDLPLVPQPKFIDAERCAPDCDDCMLGCRRGAKWTARAYLEEAEELGAALLVGTAVERVILEGGRAQGLRLEGGAEIRADQVVLAAGGIGTPGILLRSGIKAGKGFFVDPMNVVMGVGREKGAFGEMTFTVASSDTVDRDGYLIGNVGSMTVFWPQLIGRNRFRALARSPHLGRVIGLFVKISDSAIGQIGVDGAIDKPFIEPDRERFEKGTALCKAILIEAGASPKSLCVAENIGGHPGGTAAIGRVVDRDLKVIEAENLYVCDASVFPRSPGRPPTLALIALARRLAKHL